MSPTDPPTASAGPTSIHRPHSIAELQELLRSTADPVAPVGGSTWKQLGLPLDRPSMEVSSAALARVVDYPSEDLTITVESGITLFHLSEVLSKKRQTLPIDAFAPERATLGGMLATNACGPRRFGCGSPRDFVLGLDVVDARGERIHGGGRVVKNVAGYDLPRMHVGALGTLGMIVEVSLKLRPAPEARACVVCGLDAPTVPTALANCVGVGLQPTAVELMNRQAYESITSLKRISTPWVLVLLFEECRAAVESQLAAAEGRLSRCGEFLRVDEGEYAALLTDLSRNLHEESNAFAFKACVRPSAAFDFCKEAETALFGLKLQCHAGNGVVWGSIPHVDFEVVENAVRRLGSVAESGGGGVVLTQLPEAWKPRLPVWGRQRGDRFLMERLRGTLDPERRFNPGRFLVP